MALLASAFGACCATAQTLGVATWNVGWLFDGATHAQWASACAKSGWPSDSAALPPAARAALAPLPYCNVHNGMAFPPERCRAARDDWPRAARYAPDHPCRDTADLAAWAAYEQKLSALRTMFARLDREGIGVVALQEVANAAAVGPILPPGWHVATTAELPGTPRIAQHVGVAWRPTVTLRALDAVTALADSGFPDRPLRPGLAFTVDVNGLAVRMLVVHLKAGCRSRTIDAPLGPTDAQLPAARADAIASDCAMLRYQMPALEAWIDAHAGVPFAVLGDFNRTLLREPPLDTARHRVRLDGSHPGDPLGPCSMRREQGRAVVRCPAATSALLAEINDNVPPGAVLWRATFVDNRPGSAIRKGSTGDCRIMGRHGELTHDGIDHVLISDTLKRQLESTALTMRAINYLDDQGNAFVATPDQALPSDHCPHAVWWARKR
jgi:hypothetical protein